MYLWQHNCSRYQTAQRLSRSSAPCPHSGRCTPLHQKQKINSVSTDIAGVTQLTLSVMQLKPDASCCKQCCRCAEAHAAAGLLCLPTTCGGLLAIAQSAAELGTQILGKQGRNHARAPSLARRCAKSSSKQASSYTMP